MDFYQGRMCGILSVVSRLSPLEAAMKTQEIKDEWPILEENNPPLNLTREMAAFERERERLVRDHPGQIAVIHGDEVIGAFPTLAEAQRVAYGRFGLARLVFLPITQEDEEDWVSNVDVNHPSLRRLD
jgi:hypothetical protein